MKKRETIILCKNVFKSGSSTTKEDFTRLWAELIRQLERGRKIIP